VEDRIFQMETLGLFDYKSTSQGTFVNQQIFTIFHKICLKFNVATPKSSPSASHALLRD